MSSLFKSKKETKQETQIDPRVYDEVLRNLQLARQVSQIPFEPYRGMMVAPFTQDYMRGEAMTRAIAGEGGYVPEVEGAARQAAQLMGYQPQQVAAERVGTQFTPERVAAERAQTRFGVGPISAGRIGTQFAPERVAAQQLGTTFGSRDVGAALAGGPERVSAGQVGTTFGTRDIGASLAGGPERVTAGQIGTTFAAPTIGAERVGTGFTARDVAGPGAAPTVQAASLLGPQGGQTIADYMNPYQQGVIDVGLSDIDRAQEQARMQRAQRATAARAFGGSRAAVEEGIAAGEAARERNRFIAEQRAQGFREAAALREADVGRQQQAALANQAAAQNVMQLAQAGQISNQERDLRLQQLGLTAEQANQAAAMEAARANQQAQQEAQRMGMTAEQFNAQQQMAAQQANQQAVQQYMQMGLSAEQANQQAQLDAQRLGAQAQQFNVQQGMQAGLANQQAVQDYMRMGLTAEQANQQANLDAQRMGLQAGQSNQQAALQAALANQQMGMQGQQMGMQAQQFNVQQQMEAQRLNMENQLRAQGMSAEQARFNSQQAMQASLANQQAGMQAQQMGLQAQGMNQDAAMRAALANQQAGLAGAQFQLGAGRQFADLGQQALQNRYGAAAAMTGIGSAQQQLMQQYLNAQQQEFMRRINYPMQQLAVAQGAVSASPYNQTIYGQTVGTPSPMQMIGQTASTAMGMGWGGFSDERMKKNVSKIKNPLDKINRLKGIEFEWEDEYKDDVEENGQEPNGKSMSVSAQDVEDVMPEAVSMRENGMREVDFPQVVGVLTEAVKELDRKVEGKKRRRGRA